MRISDWSSVVCSSELSAGCPCPGSTSPPQWSSCSRRTAEQSSSVNHTGEDHEGFAEERLDRRCRRKRGARGRLWPALRQGRLPRRPRRSFRSEEQTSDLQSLMRRSYPGFCLKKKIRDGGYVRSDILVETLAV